MWAKSANWYEKDGIKYKQCTDCWEYKEACSELFSKKKTWFLWFRSICKDCEHKKYIMNKDVILKQSKEHYQKNKDKILWQVKEYYWKNRDKKIKYAKQYRDNNKDVIKEKDYKRYWNKRHWLNTKEEVEQYKKNKYEKRIKNRPLENWTTFHRRATDFINKYSLRPDKCCICWSSRSIQAHHPDYTKWNMIVFVCPKCHQNIHANNIQCPDPINLLELVKK